MGLTDSDIDAIWLTLKLAFTVTLILMVIGTPIAIWLARTKSWLRGPINALVSLAQYSHCFYLCPNSHSHH